MNLRFLLLAAGMLAAGAVLGYGVRVRAEGIPDTNPLYYAGTLSEGGLLVTGQRALTVNLWADGTTSGTPLCQTVESTAEVTSGRFRIALASGCKGALNQNNNAWVEVIDGATSLGRAKIGAGPYAVEADHAKSATNAVQATTADAAVHATTADTAAHALDALTTVFGTSFSAADSFGQACMTSMNAIDCGVAANRKCTGLGYAAGWFVGESATGTLRSVVCIK
jgi:hypothetical protein